MMTSLAIAMTLLSDGAWPQFRGPDGSGVVETPLPITWSETENVTWRCELSHVGHSSPVVWDDVAWMTTAHKDGSASYLLGVDLASGRLLHNVRLFTPTDAREIHHGNSYASPTPCVDGERVYAHFGRYGTAAVSSVTGKVLWRNDSIKVEHNSGPASSAVLAGGRLILVFDAMEESFVCGLDRETGKVAWKTPRSAPLRDRDVMRRAFSTPLVLHHDGRDVVVVPGPDQMNCYVAETGEELWHVRYVGFSTVPAPVTDGKRVYFCTGFYDPEVWAVSLDGLFGPDAATGDVTASHVVWRYDGAISETPSPTVHDGRVWVVSDKGVLTSIDTETGNRVSIGRVRDNVSASPLIANDRLYVFGESGDTTVWDITAEKPKQLAKNSLRSPIKASPAVVDRSLLIRTTDALIRVDTSNANE